MKKVLKKMMISIMVSFILQLCGFFYLNNSFLASNTAVKSQKVVDSSTSNKTLVSKANVPNNAKNINVSYDASYVSYYLSDVLYVVNTITGKSVNVGSSNGDIVSFYKWLPDRNRMLIVETKNRNLSLSYYDVAKSEKSNVTELLMVSSTSKVKDIEAAPLPNVIYIKVANSASYDSIYWVNIMKSRKKIVTKTENIGKIKVVPHEDKMLYEDSNNDKIYATEVSDALSFSGSTKLCLIQIDNNDQIYIGDVDSSNNIDKIYIGTLKGNWQTLKLDTPVSKTHLFVTVSGKAYINDNLKGLVREVRTLKETVYKGTFIQLYSDGIASLSDGNLVKTPFK